MDNKVTSSYDQIAALAHDIRSPLAGVTMTIRRLIATGRLFSVDEVKDDLLAIERTIAGLLAVVDYQLERERLLTTTLRPQRELICLSDLVDEAAHSVRPMGEIKQIVIRNEVPVGVRAYVDRMMFYRLIGNLIGNSIKFSAEADEVLVTYNYGVLRIIDSGRGGLVNSADSGLSGFRNSSCASSGFGLGLPICRKIVEAHGGTLELTSETGVGTTVSIRIGLGSTHIMLISSDQEVTKALTDRLEQGLISVDIDHFSDPLKALSVMEQFYKVLPNLVIVQSDNNWEGALGLTHFIREHPRGAMTSIVVFSSLSDVDDAHLMRQEAIFAGVDEFILSPSVSDELIEACMTEVRGNHSGHNI
jgi:signal transduction histidine kinase